ncbi:nitrate reductase subunit alpha [Selenomonas sp. TAMA-11512]|uniref:nitrate reductase subunit alpha n=1 Tax=Selenomonas sp. TAMA-11512 TaxID=3095337 RepID=UPI00308550DC|nr:nitrate reductase subunit alpha [Selenomonas sp. TAMA-11512]
MNSIFQKFKYLIPKEKSASGHQQLNEGGREWEDTYRNRWSFDKVVHSTHGVNCTGSCAWNIFVKNGLVAWENQIHDYPETAPDMPDFEPRGCPRGASFSWYLYSPHRIKYPYLRGELAKLWREAKKNAPNAYEAWKSIASDPAKQKLYKEARGMGGFVRSTWEEASELVAASLLYTVATYGSDRIFGFSVIPAKSMLSYAAGIRFTQLMGGSGLSFYDWYADLPPSSPQVWGEQTDVPESSDWYNAGYLITWGSNVPVTRTPDAHFLAEVRYKGTKIVSIAPDYAESSTFADTWINLKVGSDAALAMAMGHVILKEYFYGEPCEFFLDYQKRYTDMPFLLLLDEGENGKYRPGRFLNGKDLGRDDKHADFKFYVIDDKTGKLVVPNGTMGDRWDRQEKWNLKSVDSDNGEEIDARLTLIHKHDVICPTEFPYFGNEREERVLVRSVPAMKIRTAEGERLVTTVCDITMANYAIDRGLGGEAASTYDDPVPYTPKWQERYTGIPAETVIHTAREMADNSIATKGRTMIIMGGGINHWFHADIVYRTILNLLMFIGAEGRNGGGWAHYVGQEKLRPHEGWARVMSATDWNPAARLQNTTSFYYFATSQHRSEEVNSDELVSPLYGGKARYQNAADYNVLSARMGWLPSYPTFNKSPNQIYKDAQEAGFTAEDGYKDYIVQSLKDRTLEFACEDPDNPVNFPRNLFVWRANLLGSSAKGSDYFLKYLLGTENTLFAEETTELDTKEIKIRSEEEIRKPGGAAEGKLDLLVDLDFRMASTALYSDVVLPTATWYEKDDLSSTDMHPFVHVFQAAVDPLWESRTDWNIFRTLAEAVSKLAKEIDFPVYRDIVPTPLGHDSEAELSQPEGRIRDWKKGECEPIPGKTMPGLQIVDRDYTKVYDKWVALGPNVEKGMKSHGFGWESKQDYELIRKRNGTIEDKSLISYGMPSIMEAKQACDAVMALSTTTNGSVAVRAWESYEKRTGLTGLKELASDREAELFTFDQVAIQPKETITSPSFTGSNKGRRYSAFTTSIENLLPFRTVTGRQSFYLDHEMIMEWGEQLATFKPMLEYRPLKKPVGDRKELTLQYLTPHNKWSTHSMYFDSQQLLTLFRGGQTVWINEKDAAEMGIRDNDWIELYNRNGVVVSRTAVTPRLPRGTVFMHHAQDRHINVPGTKLSNSRAGTHNTPTRIHMKPTHMIGGYGQLSYGFNYYGTTGNQRDIYVVARKLNEEEVDWLED